MKRYFLILLSLALALSACSAGQGSPASLLGSWKLTSYGPAGSQTPAVADAQAAITFQGDGTLNGNSGCNGFGGNYTAKGNQVTFSEIVSTLMACDDARMAQEEGIHQVLANTATFKIEGNTLTLTNNNQSLIFIR